MRTTAEFRISREHASQYIPSNEGTDVGEYVRKVIVDVSDPMFAEIGRLERVFRAQGGYFFAGWELRHRYSRLELQAADLFHIWPKRTFEPAGEECGTLYDDSKACSECGAGAVQKTPLFLDGRHIPRNVDFARTIADEIVVSLRFVDLFRNNNLHGAEFTPIRLSNRDGKPSDKYFQLAVAGPPIELGQSTRFGEDPFDDHQYGRCPRGDLAGLNILSEVTVQRQSLHDADIMATRQMIGVHRGLLRPRHLLLLSPKAWKAIEAAKLGGLRIEVAHLV